MKPLFALALLVVCASASATPIIIDLGNPRTFPPDHSAAYPFQFSDLDGTQLQGQPLTLDLLFTDNAGNPAKIVGFKSSGRDLELGVVLFINQSLPHEQ